MNRVCELPYKEDAAELFERIADRPWSVFLDSAPFGSHVGRYSMLSCEPWISLERQGTSTRIQEAGGSFRESLGDPLQLLREVLGERVAPPIPGLPFAGGAIGYLGYELGRCFAPLDKPRPPDLPLPDMAVGVYDWVVLVDHRQKRCWLVAAGRDPRTDKQWPRLRALFHEPPRPPSTHHKPAWPAAQVRADTTREDYTRIFHRVQHYIRAGDCYQVNLAVRFRLPLGEENFSVDPWLLYRGLRASYPAPHAAFFRIPSGSVLSLSPERFLQLRGGRVRTCPIKGTRPRGATPAEDQRLLRQLVASPKDRAENLMIVDLLRNDLGKTCLPGSVRVPELFTPHSYASVHHLVSTVTGTLAPDQDALELLRGCFPGGSITGAPKLRAMQIIEELESHRRNVYCGSLFYLGYAGDMDSSIAIRTLVCADHSLYYWAGGGLVADSREEAEYREILDKAAAFFSLCQDPGQGAPGQGGTSSRKRGN